MTNNPNEPFVRLRAMEPEDLDMLYSVENDVAHWEVGATNVPYSRYVLHDYVAKSSGDIYTDKQVRMMVENADGETVGMVDVVNFSPAHRRAELSIIIRKEKRGKGFARASIRWTMHYALHTLHLRQLYVVVAKNNVPSVRLFESVGFCVQCELKDWLYDGKTYESAIVMQTFL